MSGPVVILGATGAFGEAVAPRAATVRVDHITPGPARPGTAGPPTPDPRIAVAGDRPDPIPRLGEPGDAAVRAHVLPSDAAGWTTRQVVGADGHPPGLRGNG